MAASLQTSSPSYPAWPHTISILPNPTSNLEEPYSSRDGVSHHQASSASSSLRCPCCTHPAYMTETTFTEAFGLWCFPESSPNSGTSLFLCVWLPYISPNKVLLTLQFRILPDDGPATQCSTEPQTDGCQLGLWTNPSCQLTWEGKAVLNLPHGAVGGPHWGEGGLALCHLILSRTQLFLGEELALTDLLWYFQTDSVSLCPYSVLSQAARRQQTF